jgi:uncharacterized membrane protein YqgA involved in biofilm formation
MKTLLALIRRNAKLFFKDKGTFYTAMISPLILIVLFVSFLGNVYRDSLNAVIPTGMTVSKAVTEGFVGGTLLFCVGSMTVVGSLNSGLLGDHTMLYTKSLIDMVASVVLASTLGAGVMFSAAFVLVFQGAISLCATWIAPYLADVAIAEMSAVGSLLLIAIALNMLGLTKLKVMNFMPAIFIPIIIYAFM